MKKKSISIFIVLTMIMSIAFSLTCIAAFADDGDYIEIRTVDDLYNVRNDLTANYKLMKDIDLTEATAVGGIYDYEGRGWSPIGSDDVYASNSKFTGVFDGNNHTISGIRINLTDGNKPTGTDYSVYAGLFANNAGIIRNLRLIDCDLHAGRKGYTTGYGSYRKTTHSMAYVGPIAAVNEGTIINCSTEVTCEAVGEGSYYSDIQGSSGTYPLGFGYAGGICCINKGIIDSCYNKSNVYARGFNGYQGQCGGIAYSNSNGTITNCYNLGVLGKEKGNSISQIGSGGTIKNSYYYSETDGSVVGIYYDGSGKTNTINGTQMLNPNFYSGFDFDNVWKFETATDYKYPQLRNNMMDTAKHVDIIEWKTQPTKIDFYTDEDIDPSGGVFTAYYIDDTHEDIEVTKDMLSGYDMTKLGVQTVAVTFREGSLTYDILTSTRPEVKSLTLETMPDKTEFARGTSFDFTGATAKLEYVNGKTEIIPISAEDTTGGDITKSGTYTITFEKFGKSLTFDVKVVPVKPIGIRITSPPDKTKYVEGQSLDLTGLVVKLDYNSGKTETITDYTVGEYTNTVGTKKISVTYEDFSASFNVEFVEKKLTNIMVTTQPTKAKYVVGEKFDRTGMVVKAVYDSGVSEEITDYQVSEITNTTGWQNLTVSYEGKTTTVKVMVEDKELVSIFVDQMPTKTTYIEGEKFDSEGLIVKANYNNVFEEEIIDYTLSGTTLNKPGERKITVLYEGLTATFNVTVVEKQLIKITVIPPTKTEYIAGEEFDKTGMVVNAIYDNGKSEEVTGYTISGFGDSEEDNVVTIGYGGKNSAFIVIIHSPEDKWTVTQAASCTTGGAQELHCANCGKVLKTENLDALGHDWSEWEIVDAPNCTDKGSQKRVCGRCNVEEFKDVDPKGHSWIEEYVVDIAPTCISEGSESWHCSECGVINPESVRIIEKLPHNLGEWTITKDATCAVAGVKQRACADCDYLETEEIPATGNHEYGEWKVVNEATCTEAGSKARECSVCHNVEKEELPATGKHEFGDWKVVKEASCTEAGIKARECTVCHKEETEELPATDHAWSNTYTVDKEATCIAAGSESIHCTKCNEVKEGSTREIPIKDHSFGEWEITKVATENAAGQKTRICSVCGQSEIEPIAILKPTLPAVKISKLVAAKKAATVKWKKVNKANQKKIAKIQIQYSLDKNFKKGVKTVTAKKTAITKKITKLKSKKTYYVRIRAYKKSGRNVHISKWSAVKKVKIR